MIDRKETERRLMMSDTFLHLAELSKTMPINVNDLDDLKIGLSVPILHLILALDDDNILFKNQEDAGYFIGLLALSLNAVYDGKLADYVKTATVN